MQKAPTVPTVERHVLISREGSLFQQLHAIVAAVGEEILDPWPALADGLEDHCAHINSP